MIPNPDPNPNRDPNPNPNPNLNRKPKFLNPNPEPFNAFLRNGRTAPYFRESWLPRGAYMYQAQT